MRRNRLRNEPVFETFANLRQSNGNPYRSYTKFFDVILDLCNLYRPRFCEMSKNNYHSNVNGFHYVFCMESPHYNKYMSWFKDAFKLNVPLDTTRGFRSAAGVDVGIIYSRDGTNYHRISDSMYCKLKTGGY